MGGGGAELVEVEQEVGGAALRLERSHTGTTYVLPSRTEHDLKINTPGYTTGSDATAEKATTSRAASPRRRRRSRDGAERRTLITRVPLSADP